jgi:acid phosphatase (class B)
LKRLLPARPIAVGFDVDDTLIFSAPAFNGLEPAYPADVIRPKDYNALTAAQRRQYHDFWNRLNEEYDGRSIPKRIGKQLLDLHIQRGDEIYIISRRQKTVPPTTTVTRRLERLFDIRLRHPVVQTNLKDKTPFIAARHIVYYYGDSDSDVTAAVGARAVPIRVQRSPASYAKDQPHKRISQRNRARKLPQLVRAKLRASIYPPNEIRNSRAKSDKRATRLQRAPP